MVSCYNTPFGSKTIGIESISGVVKGGVSPSSSVKTEANESAKVSDIARLSFGGVLSS